MNYLKCENKVLYLDWNIFILIKENKNTLDLINSDNYNIVYSPAHIEDLTNSISKSGKNIQVVENDLKFLEKVTNKKEFYPNHGDLDCRKAVCLVEESPIECFKRVIKDYGNTLLAEDLNRETLQSAKEKNYLGFKSQEINNISPLKIFDEIFSNVVTREQFIRQYNNHISNYKKQYSFLSNSIKELTTNDFSFYNFNTNFFNLLTIIEMLANLLDVVGYWKDNIKNAHNRMNDISHIIYGSFSSKFITSDKRLFKRIQAIYHFLKITDLEILFFDQKNQKLQKDIN